MRRRILKKCRMARLRKSHVQSRCRQRGLRREEIAWLWDLCGQRRLLSDVGAATIPPKDGAKVSMPGFNDSRWLVATVPGTVLTTMVDRGIYPARLRHEQPAPFGVAQQANLFVIAAGSADDPRHRTGDHLHFAGINYAAEVWVNGQRLGQIRGAFRRGDFNVTHLLRPNATNALCRSYRTSPSSGIPQGRC